MLQGNKSPLFCTQKIRKRSGQICKGQGPPDKSRRPGQANIFVLLQSDIFKTLTAYDRAGESFWEHVAKLRIIFWEIITSLENSLLTQFNTLHIPCINRLISLHIETNQCSYARAILGLITYVDYTAQHFRLFRWSVSAPRRCPAGPLLTPPPWQGMGLLRNEQKEMS